MIMPLVELVSADEYLQPILDVHPVTLNGCVYHGLREGNTTVGHTKLEYAFQQHEPDKTMRNQIEITKPTASETENGTSFPIYCGLEQWELVELMGSGAHSKVYRARDLTGKPDEVAIKVIPKSGVEVIIFNISGRHSQYPLKRP
jgi:hypothetical protein